MFSVNALSIPSPVVYVPLPRAHAVVASTQCTHLQKVRVRQAPPGYVKRGVIQTNNRGPPNASGRTDVTDALLVRVSGHLVRGTELSRKSLP